MRGHKHSAGTSRSAAGARARPAPADVLLVSMPFGPVFWPSLGLGLLAAALDRQGIGCRTRYFTIAFAELLGERLYDRIAMSSTLTVRELAGEWIFSAGLFAQDQADVERYVEHILVRREGYLIDSEPVPPALRTSLRRARSLARPFLDRCAAEIIAARPRVLGFTSVFQQHVASLALAQRVKAACPDVVIVFGGANCEGVMGAETLRQFPWVDAAVSGEGDLVFPEMVSRVLSGRSIDGIPGVRTQATIAREFAAGAFPSAAPVRALDELPYPTFDDYFTQFGASRFARGWEAGLFVETSRGCWWGERHHCTFCGLNGATMTFRSKSPARALDELVTLSARHPHAEIQVVDNILDMEYMKTLLPELARRKLDFGLFYETKSNLKQEQVRLLRDAGVRTIQPGIESFSDELLTRMRKGVSALQNVQVLKWCRQYGVLPLWNLMWGFPGEPAEAYAAMAKLVPLLVHLPPPAGSFGLRLDRFSPHFDRAAEFGFTGVTPLPAYAHVYPLPLEARANLAYYFAFNSPDPHPDTYVRPLLAALDRWRRVHAASDLFSVEQDGSLLVCDLRAGFRARVVALDDVDAMAHRIAASLSSEDQVVEGVRRLRPDVDAAAVHRSIRLLLDEGLLVQMGKRVVALALPVGEYRPSAAARARFRALARRQGIQIRRSSPDDAPRRLAADVVSAATRAPARA